MSTLPLSRRGGASADDAALAFVSVESAVDAGTDKTAQTDDELAAARADRTRRMLDFEASWQHHGGAKARAIRAEFGWSTTRYYQVLDGLLATPEALAYDPMLVRRLLRLRER